LQGHGFAKDIQRYLECDPVEACPLSASYKLRKRAQAPRGPRDGWGICALARRRNDHRHGLTVWANRKWMRAVNAEKSATEQQVRTQEREQMAIDAVRHFGDVVRETPELEQNPFLAPLRSKLSKEPQAFYKRLCTVRPFFKS
jgi:hypothetical protein